MGPRTSAPSPADQSTSTATNRNPRNRCRAQKGQPIRMLSCDTGKGAGSFAQNLANKMGVPVEAPTELVWAYPNGQKFVAAGKYVPGANGQMKGGVHLKAPDYTPLANVMLSLLHKLGADDLHSFGDSTGSFPLASSLATE